MRDLLDAIADLFSRRGQHDLFVAHVRQVISLIRDDAVRINAAWHPLGFVHFALGEIADRAKVRLHVWPRGVRRPQEPRLPIHDHIFRLESHVLLGTILNRSFDVIEDRTTPTHRVFQVEYEGDASVLVPTGTIVKSRPVDENVFRAGDTYIISKGSYHSSHVSAEAFTSTLVLATTLSDKSPLVLGPLDTLGTFRYRRQVCSESEMRAMLDAIYNALHS